MPGCVHSRHRQDEDVRPGLDPGQGVDLGQGVTDTEVKAFQRDVVALWGKVLRLAGKATVVEGAID